MKSTRLLSLVFAFALLFNVSCSKDSETMQPYENGYLVADEGNFGSPNPNANVTFISKDLSTVSKNIYTTVNNMKLGDVLQHITISADMAVLVVNNSNIVKVVDKNTFVQVAEITQEISQPRYALVANNYIYVTNSKAGENYVSIYKSSDFSFVKKIILPGTAERIVEANGTLFVQNAAWGFGNKLTRINPNTNEIIGGPVVLPNAINKTISHNQYVYSIAKDTSGNSYIYTIANDGQIVKTTTLNGINDATNLDIEGSQFYFTSGNKIYTMEMNATAAPTTPLITVTDNGFSSLYGFNVLDGKIFTSDAKGFTESSEIKIYSTAGTLLKTLTAGIGSNGFYKN